MELLGQAVLVPLSLASLGTGLIQAFGTPWGLVRHYWVVFKLLITIFATLVLVLYLPTFRAMAEPAGDPSIPLSAVRNGSPVLHGSAALVLLMAATLLSVLKPRGLTPFGRRWQRFRNVSASAR